MLERGHNHLKKTPWASSSTRITRDFICTLGEVLVMFSCIPHSTNPFYNKENHWPNNSLNVDPTVWESHTEWGIFECWHIFQNFDGVYTYVEVSSMSKLN